MSSIAMTNHTSSNYFGITATNVQLLFVGSVVRNREDCKLECIKFIRENLTVENCISYFLFSIKENSNELKRVVFTFIWTNISEVGDHPEFLNLSVNEINTLTDFTAVNSPAANDIAWLQKLLSNLLLSIHKWMAFDANLRLEDFATISSKFPLRLVDAETLRKIYTEDDHLKQNSFCLNLYLRTIESKYFEEKSKSCANCSLTLPAPPEGHQAPSQGNINLPSVSHNSVIVQNESNRSGAQESPQSNPNSLRQENTAIGPSSPKPQENRKRPAGEIEFLEVVPIKRNITAEIDIAEAEIGAQSEASSDGPTPKIYFLAGTDNKSLLEMDLKNFSTKKTADFPFEENYVCLLYHANKIFAVCTNLISSNGKREITQTVRYLDVRKKIWLDAPSMNKPRFHFGWALLGDSIYVFGGLRRDKLNPSIEKFWDPFSAVNGRWVTLEETLHPRADHAVGVLGDKIYMVGGLVSRSPGHGISSSVEAFDPEKKTWSRKSSMPSKKVGLCLAVVNSLLYAIGGGGSVQKGNEQKTCTMFDQEKNEWKSIAPLNEPRQNASAFVLDGTIYVVGGNQGPPTMEKYDVCKNTWAIVDDCHLPLDGHYRSVAFAIN